MITCSTSAGSIFARSTAARMASPPRTVAGREASAPPSLPNGVRAVARITIFVRMPPLFWSGVCGPRGPGRLGPAARRLGTDDPLVVGAVLALELQGHMTDAELGAHPLVDPAQQRGCFADPRVVEEDVRRERVRLGAEGPDVQVVDVDHAG